MFILSTIFDLAVIGGGPAGYAAAIRGAQLGGKVILVEKNKLGGVCTNLGCIPTKASLRAVEIYSEIQAAKHYGVFMDEPRVQVGSLRSDNGQIVERLRKGIEHLLRANEVEILTGTASITRPGEILVRTSSDTMNVHAKAIVIATGSRPIIPPIPGVKGEGIFTSDEAVDLDHIPDRLAIVGGGPVGTEFASIYSCLGSRVVIIEMMPRLLPFEDSEMGARLSQAMKKRGVEVVTNATVSNIKNHNATKSLTASSPTGKSQIEVDEVLLAVGRKPDTDDLGLERCGVRLHNSKIVVDSKMQTNLPGIYAVGDVTGGVFAHVAYAEGFTAAENAMGLASKMNYKAVPRCIYTIPEVACVGKTEDEAKSLAEKITVGRFPFSASGRAYTLRDTEGLVKIVAEGDSGKILGVHIIGPRASDLITEAVLAINLNATLNDIVNTIHPHPTLSEGIREAALDAVGFGFHTVRRKPS